MAPTNIAASSCRLIPPRMCISAAWSFDLATAASCIMHWCTPIPPARRANWRPIRRMAAIPASAARNFLLWGGWAAGATPPPDSPSLAQLIRKGTDVVVQIHYHPSGKPEEDQSSLGLKFSGPPTKGRAGIILSEHRIQIPAGDPHYVVKTGVTVPRDV